MHPTSAKAIRQTICESGGTDSIENISESPCIGCPTGQQLRVFSIECSHLVRPKSCGYAEINESPPPGRCVLWVAENQSSIIACGEDVYEARGACLVRATEQSVPHAPSGVDAIKKRAYGGMTK